MHDEPAETFYDPLAEGAKPLPASGDWADASRALPTAAVPLGAKFFLWAALVWLFIALAAGLTYALQFVAGWGDALIPLNEAHSPARMRMSHTSVMIYGFILNVFFAGMFATTDADDAAAGRRAVLGVVGWIALQSALALGIGDVLYGRAGEVPWAEFAPGTLVLLQLSVLWTLGSFLFLSPHAARRGGALPYFVLCFSFLGFWLASSLAMYAMIGQPEFGNDRGLSFAAYQSALVDLALLPLGLAVMMRWLAGAAGEFGNRFLPGALGMLIASAIYRYPGVDRYAAAVSFAMPPLAIFSAVLFLAAIAHILGQFGSFLYSAPAVPGGRWVWLSLGSGTIYVIERALLLWPAFREPLRFTDWTVAHHHTLFVGLFGSWCFALIDWLGPRLKGAEAWRWPEAAFLHFIFTAFGLAMMVGALEAAGWTQSARIEAGAAWADVLTASRPFWIAREAGGAALVMGQLFLLANLIATRQARLPAADAIPQAAGGAV